jgi:tetratricopeptide (TPR) repeat protein
VLDYAVEAITPPDGDQEKKEDWSLPYTNILRYAVSLKWIFPDQGRLDFIPAGKQVPSYASRMNSFDWRNFYDRLGGGAFLEAIKERMREEYDYILIDSRTGVSDTSGICTIQMPDILVICFTLNNQNINGAASVATSVSEQRGKYKVSIYPVPMRIENAEKRKLELRKEYAKSIFSMFPIHLTDEDREKYIEEVQYPYVPYYAYEEILATFGDNPASLNTVLAATERLTSYLTNGEVRRWIAPTEAERKEVLAHYEGVKRHDKEPLIITQDGRKTADQQFRIIAEPLGSYALMPLIVDTVFVSYAHQDESLYSELENHLAFLKRQGRIKRWHPRVIEVGKEWETEIDEHLNNSKLILPLVSPEFIASDYCYGVEMIRAMELHKAGDARVIPVILRPCNWKASLLGELHVLPKNALPVTEWQNRDDAFNDIAKDIRQVVDEPIGPSSSRLTMSASRPKTLPHTFIPRPPVIGFVARRDADGRNIVERLKEELAPRKNQLVTLSGPGGIGKTTLAAEAARALEELFGGRIVWSSAAGRADFTLSTLLDDIVTQLGRADLRTLASDEKEAQVLALVADPLALVVLDNYETIAPDEQKRIEKWFEQAQCSALFTSRPRQSIGTTLNITVTAMSREEAREFLERLIAQTQDAQIFTGEVRQRIYETAEANPFVMQWVVAQIDAAQEPLAVLGDLAHGEGDAAQRVFDRSFNLPQLGDDGRAALLALSLFVPSAAREALAEVAGFGKDLKRVNEAVKNLRALWLIKAIDENRRFTVEGLTRSLAGARLSRDAQNAEFRQRFIAYFLTYAKAHAQPTPEDYDVLEAERENLLSAIDVAFGSGDWQSVQIIAAIVASPVSGVLSVRGYWDDVIRCNEKATAAARKANDEGAIAGFSANIATIRINRGEYDEARQAYQQALITFKKLGEDKNVAISLHQLGMLAQNQGEIEEARRLYDESLEIEKRFGNQNGIAISLHQLAMLAQAQGEIEEARRLYSESLEINKRLGQQSVFAISLHQLGMLAQNQGEIEEARRLYDESLEIEKRLGNQSGIASNLHNLAAIAQAQGEIEEARRLYDESLEINKRLGNQGGIASTLGQMGILAQKEGNKVEAVRLLREALHIFEKLKSPYTETIHRILTRIDTAE